jgi:putative ABC transport system permease protein
MNLLLRSSFRYLQSHHWQLIFSILGVALGVAIVTGIELASNSANRSFQLSSQSLSGQANYRIISDPASAQTGYVPEHLYTTLRNELGLSKLTPLLKYDVFLTQGQSVQLTGVDPFSEADVRQWQQQTIDALGGNTLQQLLSTRGGVLVAADFLIQNQLQTGDQVTIALHNQIKVLTIVGTFKVPELYRSQVQHWFICDISTAQEVLALQGYLSQIDLYIDENDTALQQQVNQHLPENVQLIKVSEHHSAIQRLSRSFELNLKAMSLLGLLVAMFLIYNTMMFSVVQRRNLMARLRLIGVSRQQLFIMVLMEALAIGVVATLVGTLFGVYLAQSLLFFMTRTINDHYYLLQVSQIYLSEIPLLKVLLLGICATMTAAFVPALEAAFARPVSAIKGNSLERSIHVWSKRLLLPGLAGILLVVLLVKYQVGDMTFGFAIVFLLILALLCLLPLLTRFFLASLAPVMKHWFSLPGKMAVNNILRSFSRSIVAIAALTVSVASALAISVMIDSFRITLDNWLSGYLKADYYIRAAESVEHEQSAINAALVEKIQQLPGIKWLSSDRDIRFYDNGRFHELTVFDIPESSFSGFRFKSGGGKQAMKAWLNDDAVLVSEPYAYKHGIKVGEFIRIPLDDASRSRLFKVVGVYDHYGSEQGMINMSRATYNRHWSDRTLDSLGIYLDDGNFNLNTSLQVLQQLVNNNGLMMISKQSIQKQALDIFDQTFRITSIIKLLVVIVSFVGIISALMAMLIERGKAFAILRATGLTPGELSRLIYLESFTMGLVAAVFSIPFGMAIAWLLIDVINYRSFGWSIDFHLTLIPLASAILLALTAALLAAVYPARLLTQKIKLTRALSAD